MENVICTCLKCNSGLGTFKNAWLGIGNSYYSPIYAPVSHRNGFVATGEVFAKGPDGSAVQNSVLQDLACRVCSTVVGLRCDDTPEGHLLKKNQLILRLGEMKVVSEHSGENATIVVEEKIPLLPPGVKKPSAARRTASVQPHPRAGSLAVHGNSQSKNNEMPPPPAKENPGTNLARFTTWAEGAIYDQQKDIDRIGGAVARIEKDMRSFKEFMAEVRAELAANRETRKTQDDLKQEQIVWIQEDLKELRQDNDELRQDMKEEALPGIRNELEQLRQELDPNNRLTELPGLRSQPHKDEVKILRDSVMRIDQKFNEVEGLKAELQRLQRRLADFEDKRQAVSIFPTMADNPKEVEELPESVGQAPEIPRQQPQLMFRAPVDVAHSPARTRLISPSPPGAFPQSIVDIYHSHDDTAAETGSIPLHPENVELVETASVKVMSIHRWVYSGPQRWPKVRDAFKAFELQYPKIGALPEKITVLEDHVNNSGIHYSELAKVHGKMIMVEERTEIAEVPGPSRGKAGSTRSKRKLNQDDNTVEQLPESPTKKRKGATASAKKNDVLAPNSSLKSPSPIHEAEMGSPELGRASLLRSVAAKASVSDSQPRSAGRLRKNAGVEMANVPTPPVQLGSEVQRIKSESYDELSSIAQITPRGEIALMPSIERDDNHVPGSFPKETPRLRRG